ncbi:DC1 [Arabidopsis suecica]|uniref:DC1 n=1 Tax=Arabidopsis suecica TaxID=45249 RepID=A0A8T2CNL0_ARASU|nr:DC1 [Arabidopsis suecica]
MDSMEMELSIHPGHLMTPLKDGRMGNCCGIKFQSISDGYYCCKCDFFAHKRCSNPPEEINYPSHKCDNTLIFGNGYLKFQPRCGLCGVKLMDDVNHYRCPHCGIQIHLDCAKYPPPKVIEVPHHDHKLKLQMWQSCFTCATCGKVGDGYPYKCLECRLTIHVICGKYATEVNHPSHSLHPLKLFNGEPPAYTDGKCRLCCKKLVDEAFYHCSSCNFTLDLHCFFNPPPIYHYDLNIHAHKLTRMPKMISFTCTTCGLHGDRSPYVCLPCDFTAHSDCSGFPWVININRHDHRVSRTPLIGVVNSVCRICQKKMDWTCGGYSCKRCPDSVYHTKCATRKDVWDGREMKDIPEEKEDIEPFKVIDENTIQHFLHKSHNLRLDKSGTFIEERSCKACTYPIYHHSFYSCMSCDYMLHEICANMPTRKRHMVINKPYYLDGRRHNFNCEACGLCCNGFKYSIDDGLRYGLDMRCASVTEPFVHQSHPHPLFYTSPRGVCSVCNKEAHHVLRCVEDNCKYVLDFKCALLPYDVKHRVDDHFISLCYGEDASGKYWCDICEKETDPNTWFYTCKDCGVTLHIDCVLGDFRALEPERTVTRMEYKGVQSVTFSNNSMSRPLCNQCKSRCMYPIILKVMDEAMPDVYYCSINCFDITFIGTRKYSSSIFCITDHW